MRSRWLQVAWVSVLAGCGILDPDSTTRSYEVAPYKSTCSGLWYTLCLQVREPGALSFENMFETPSGFDFEWGVGYVILVEETEVENPPADGSSIRRSLVRTLERSPVPVGAVFEIPVPGEALIRESGDVFRLFPGRDTFRCEVAADCDALEALPDRSWVMLTMGYPDEPGGPIRLVQSEACGERPFCLD